jgi:hypothetical protein
MSHGFQVAQVIEGHDVELRRVLLLHNLKHLPADAAQAIDSNARGHANSPILRWIELMEF